MITRHMADSKFKYKNSSDQEQALIGFGLVGAGEVIETDEPIHNPNFTLVNAGRMVNVEAPVAPPKVNKTLKG